VHQTYFDYLQSINSLSSSSLATGHGRDLGNGHAVLEMESPHGRPLARWAPMYGDGARHDMGAMRQRLVDRVGEERAFRMADNIRLLLIFPNLVINDIVSLTIRYFEPVAPDELAVHAWAMGPADETEEQLARRLNSFLIFIGPGGFATPDDVEVLEECQRGFRTIGDNTYSDISRGMLRDPLMNDELQMRTFWRAWKARLMQSAPPARVTDVECAAGASTGVVR
jgi:p-cumate 2,3-dioxygenase alpha subunit